VIVRVGDEEKTVHHVNDAGEAGAKEPRVPGEDVPF
jgi:hypothetical protein